LVHTNGGSDRIAPAKGLRAARPIAVLLKTMPSGLARLEREGRLRRAEADLLDLVPVRLLPDAKAPSRIVDEGRSD
jgi:hypothetical protein